MTDLEAEGQKLNGQSSAHRQAVAFEDMARTLRELAQFIKDTVAELKAQ